MNVQELEQRLQAADPIDPESLEAWAHGEDGQAILSRIVDATRPRSGVRVVVRSRYRWIAVVAGATATALAGVLLVPLIDEDGASAAAARALNAAALVAEKQPGTALPADGYWYTKSKGATRAYVDACSVPSAEPRTCPMDPPNDWAFSVLTPSEREVWVAGDGSGRILTRRGTPTFFGPEDEADWNTAGKPPLDRAPRVSDESYGPGELTHTDFSSYSADPDELYEQMRDKAEGYGPSTDAEMLVLVGDLLRETIAPPKLRAALFRLATRIPGVELLGSVVDPAGRQGVGVARTSDDSGFLQRVELIFDLETSALLAEREILLERVEWADAQPGTVLGYTAYLESGVVEATSHRP